MMGRKNIDFSGIYKRKLDDYKITTLDIEVVLMKHFKFRQNVIIPNVSWGLGLHECDLLIVRKSLNMTEIEIKISKSDLLKDFDKKHGHQDKKNRIREFYYAIPENLYIQCKDLIPENAGIIVCSKNLNYKKDVVVSVTVKRKSKINSSARKLTNIEYNKLLRLGCYRIFTLKNKLLKTIKDGKR